MCKNRVPHFASNGDRIANTTLDTTPNPSLGVLGNLANDQAMRPSNQLKRFSTQSLFRFRGISCSLNNPIPWVCVAFVLLYLALIRYCSTAFFRDPTSVFFDPVRGYARQYSLTRQSQADAFIEKSNSSPGSRAQSKGPPKLCIGIATVARENEQYIRSTIGSLIEPLSRTERDQIYLAVLIAHTEPNDHPVYAEPWLTNLANKVLLYDIPPGQRDQLEEWEDVGNFSSKAIFDYVYVMQKCVDRGAKWVAVIEDDTLAVRDWFPRLMDSLIAADIQHNKAGNKGEWLYLRMFFTEDFLGWNKGEWPKCVFTTLLRMAAHVTILLVVRRFVFKKTLTNSMVALWSLVFVPALITLYYLAGRLSMHPLKPGVHEMSSFGCCAQGLVFSSSMATKTIAHLREEGVGFVDQLIEVWANEMDYVRWAIVPSLLQHIGVHSSKGDDLGAQAKWHRSVAEKIWNFGFETYDDHAFRVW